MSFFPLIFLSFLTNQTEKKEKLKKKPLKILKISSCFLWFLLVNGRKKTQKKSWKRKKERLTKRDKSTEGN